jgi:aldehyde:ferredoxin oxidoreductase
MLGLDFEYYLLTSCTGLSISKQELDVFGERVINLERQLLIRNFDRCRTDDESVIPYFEREEHNINPLIGRPMALDRQKFMQLMDEYYALRGWDKDTGAPQKDKLQQLGLAFTLSA